MEATQLDNTINYLEKKIGVHSLSERYNVFTEEIIRIALSSNDDKRMQSINSIETYAYGTSKDLVSEKEEIKCNSIIKQYKID